MTTLKPGDRVRITRRVRVPGYRTGDKGTVFSGPQLSTIGGLSYYIVSMDKDNILNTAAVFTEDEIEPDV